MTRINGRRAVIATLAAVVITLTGCSSTPGATTPDAAGTTPGTTATTAPGSAGSPGATPTPAGSRSATRTPTQSRTTARPPTTSGGAAPAHFTTLPPGAKLPSDAQCATWVRQSTYKENKGSNKKANATTGNHLGSNFFSGDDGRANSVIAPRVDGQFTGTTHQILRWAACKWGIDEDIVYAQAAIESWWRQDTLGDFGTDATRCPPGHGLGADGKSGQCPESYGILQNRYPYEQSSWPGIGSSTAMNADLAYGIWRTCFEGYEGWLNTVEQGSHYAAGDAWGCVGRWFAGRWHTQPAEDYVSRVKGYLSQRIWETPDFQQP